MMASVEKFDSRGKASAYYGLVTPLTATCGIIDAYEITSRLGQIRLYFNS